MKEIELCMKYDTCKRCPLNTYCEYLYMGDKNAKDLQNVWGGKRRPYLSSQKKPRQKGKQRERQVPKDKAVDKQKYRDKTKG